MSPMYGYEMHRSPIKQKEFVEVVFADCSKSDKTAEDDVMDTALDNPCYQSYNDLSKENKVHFFCFLCCKFKFVLDALKFISFG